jgi:hypothetical protein
MWTHDFVIGCRSPRAGANLDPRIRWVHRWGQDPLCGPTAFVLLVLHRDFDRLNPEVDGVP